MNPLVPVLFAGAGAALLLSGDSPAQIETENKWPDFFRPIIDYDVSSVAETVSDIIEETRLYFSPAIEYPEFMTPVKTYPSLDAANNLAAFLKLIRQAESSDNYYALVGGGNFFSTNDHPYLTGEFEGIKRKDGRLTTAAGAYQIVKTTWLDLGGIKKYGSFSPAAQDIAAVDLITRRGALTYVKRGDIANAIRTLRNEWEFLVQPKWTAEKVASSFTNNGGVMYG